MTYQRSIARQIEEEEESNSPEARTLIPLVAAKHIAWRGYDTILDLVDELPKNVAAECNPSNPQVAFAALEADCRAIVCQAYELYAEWTKVGPHISATANTE